MSCCADMLSSFASMSLCPCNPTQATHRNTLLQLRIGTHCSEISAPKGPSCNTVWHHTPLRFSCPPLQDCSKRQYCCTTQNAPAKRTELQGPIAACAHVWGCTGNTLSAANVAVGDRATRCVLSHGPPATEDRAGATASYSSSKGGSQKQNWQCLTMHSPGEGGAADDAAAMPAPGKAPESERIPSALPRLVMRPSLHPKAAETVQRRLLPWQVLGAQHSGAGLVLPLNLGSAKVTWKS